MDDQTPESINAGGLKVSPWMLTSYAFTLALITELTFWGIFRVDAMSYMGLQDVLRLAAPTLVMMAVALPIQAGLLFFTDPNSPHALKAFRGKREFGTPLLVVTLVVAAIALLGVWNGYLTFVVVTVLAATVGAIAYHMLQRWKAFAPNLSPIARAGAAVALAIGPSLAFALGCFFSFAISSRISYEVASVQDGQGKSLCGPEWPTDAVYIGKINDYLFFGVQNATCVVRAESLPAFTLTHHEMSERPRIPFLDPPKWKIEASKVTPQT